MPAARGKKTLAPAQDEQAIVLNGLRIQQAVVTIEGITPLLMHRLDEETLRVIVEGSEGKASGPKEHLSVEREFQKALYRTEDGGFGFPGAGIKKCLIDGGRFAGMVMTRLKGSIFILEEMIPLTGDDPQCSIMSARNNRGQVVPTIRGRFNRWAMRVPVQFTSEITQEQLVNLFAHAGYSVGIGAFRPQCSGMYGRFAVKAIELSEPFTPPLPSGNA